MTYSLKDIPILIKNNKFLEAIKGLDNLDEAEKRTANFFF